MTSNRLPKWQQSLNQKLVQRLNHPLTEPGIINNRMAKKIIDRSPDLLARLPLLAQQMQRWSTIVDLQSEETPIVYVQHQEAKQNSSFRPSDPSPGKKQLPLVKAKLVQSSASSPDGEKKQPLVDVRSQPTASALTQDNSDITAITPLISVTPTNESSVNPIQRKLDSGTFSPESASLNIDSEIPVVYGRSQTVSSEAISEQPLVNLSQEITSSSTDINPPLISVTPTNESSVNPIQRKLDSGTFSSESASLNIDSEIPVVYGRSQTPSLGIYEQPLVNLSQQIANSSTDINPSLISVTPTNESSVNPIQRKLDSGTFSSENSSLNIDSDIPVVYGRSQTPSLGISEQPLVNLSQQIANSSTDINPSLISVTPTNESSVNPIQRKLDSGTFSSENSSLNIDSDIPVVYGRSQTVSSEAISEQPLVNLSQPIANSSDINPSLISVTPTNESSVNPIQRKLDNTIFSSESPSLNIDSDIPVVYGRSQTVSSGISEQPLVNLSQPIANSSDINPPLISVTPTNESSANLIQRKLDSGTFSSESPSLNIDSDIPVVYGRSQTPSLEAISEQPLVNLSQPIANSSTEINNQDLLSIPIIPIGQVYTSNNQNKLDNSAVVYSQPLSPQLASTEQMLLIQEFERNNPSVVSKESEKNPKSLITNPQSYTLPVVEVNSERSPPEFEPLIFSASPIAKQRASSLNGEALNYQPKSIVAANYNRTSSTHQETSIANSSNQSIITASTSSPNAHQQPKVNQTTQTSLAGVNLPPQIDIDALADKVERKIMRRLVVESERRGKKKWR